MVKPYSSTDMSTAWNKQISYQFKIGKKFVYCA